MNHNLCCANDSGSFKPAPPPWPSRLALISGGATFFGFQTNQTYTLTLRAGNVAEALRSTSGDA